LLASKGCNLEQADNDGYTALHISCQEHKYSAAELLISKGCNLEARTNDGATPLIRASRYGHCDIMVLLLENGSDIEAVIDRCGYTSICIAVLQNQRKAVELLIAKGANWNTPTNQPPSTQFRTLLQIAEESGLSEMVEILETANKRKKKKEYQRRKKEEAKLLKEMGMREEKIAAEKRMVGGDEEENEVDDCGSIGIEDQIEEMNLSPPPAVLQEVVVNSPRAKAADTTAESADITTATTSPDTTSLLFSSYSVAELSAWLTTTIKTIPQSVLTELENNEVDGMMAIELDKRDDWKELGLNNIQSAKVIAEIKKLLLKDDGS
jgi:hypothetical protein